MAAVLVGCETAFVSADCAISLLFSASIETAPLLLVGAPFLALETVFSQKKRLLVVESPDH